MMHIISKVNVHEFFRGGNVHEFTLQNRVISRETNIKPTNDAHRVIRKKKQYKTMLMKSRVENRKHQS
jgi:hypothetical protein